jgi:carboxyl-terminal processing protease
MKKIAGKWPVLAVIILGFLIVFGPYYASKVSARDKSIYKDIKTFSEVLDMVQKNYVEEVDSSTLIQGAINGMIKSLDPHSVFMTPEMYKELSVETQGQFGGIGIEITILKDVLTVVSPIEDTPAFHAGVKSGDQIIKIDGQSTKDITIMEAVKKLRGPRNTKVTITIMRQDDVQSKDIILTRDIIQIRSVRSRVYDDHIGYIRIASFHERTSADLRKALAEVSSKTSPMKGLVLDLRNDPGGLLDQAIEVSDMFLKSGVIVSTRGRSSSMDIKSVAKDTGGSEVTIPMVVLVNEGTASAAEIVAGALQDNSRALIVGTQTFGKASVQTVIPLADGSALKLTTARYYTPSGKSIQAEGIKPDIVVKAPLSAQEPDLAPEERLREKDLKNHIKQGKDDLAAPGEKGADSTAEALELARDPQLKTAIDILKSWRIMKQHLAGNP